MRHRPALPAILLCIFVLRVPAQQPISDEEKKRLFLKAREEMTTIPYTPPPSTAPGPKPKPRTTPAAAPSTPRPTPSPIVRPAPEPTPRATPLPVSTPRPIRNFTPPPQRPNIVVRESAVAIPDEDRAPTPQPQSFFSRLFGSATTYRYLTNTVRRAIDRAPVTRGRWRYIVVHNSGTRQGSARAFEHYHRYVRKMPNGLAYHFVIGNGTSTKDGAVEIGNRWHRQMQGGHVHSDYLNNIAIGICLVGDFNQTRPRQGQLAALGELIDYLRGRVGRIQGQAAVVRAHREINPPQWPTDCPGDEFPYRWLRSKFERRTRDSMQLALTGATGFVGRHVIRLAIRRGFEVVAFTRDPSQPVGDCIETRQFSTSEPPDLRGCDAVIHLAGENVAGLWTRAKMHRIRDSRILGTRQIAQAIRASSSPPSVLVSASAIGFYGDSGEQELTEDSPHGAGFLAETCLAWEAEAIAAGPATRVVRTRIGLVMGKSGGALRMMLPAFRLGLGARLGSGRQWLSWIHVEDLASLLLFAVEDLDLRGPVNATAPWPARNSEFTAALARSLHRPAFLAIPAFALRMVLGDFSHELLDSKRVLPAVATAQGFGFRFSELTAAISDIVA